MSSLQLNSNCNDLILLLTTLFSHRRLLGSEAKQGNVGPTFSSFNVVPAKITKKYTMVCAPWCFLFPNSTGALFSVMGKGPKLQHRIGTKQQYPDDIALLVALNI